MLWPIAADYISLIDDQQSVVHAAKIAWESPVPTPDNRPKVRQTALCGRGEFFVAAASTMSDHLLALEWPPHASEPGAAKSLHRCGTCWNITGKKRPSTMWERAS